MEVDVENLGEAVFETNSDFNLGFGSLSMKTELLHGVERSCEEDSDCGSRFSDQLVVDQPMNSYFERERFWIFGIVCLF